MVGSVKSSFYSQVSCSSLHRPDTSATESGDTTIVGVRDRDRHIESTYHHQNQTQS